MVINKISKILALTLISSFPILFSCKGNSVGMIPKAYECGNSELETGEQCDDGNLVAGDGCDESCRNEIDVTTSKTVELDQSNCGETFSEPNVLYELKEDIECPGTAFSFTKGEIIFEGNDYEITYGAAGGDNPGLAIIEWNTRNTIFRNFSLNQHANATGGNGIHSSFEPRRVRIQNVNIEGGIGMTDWHTISFNAGSESQLIDVIAYSHSTHTSNRHQFTGRNIYIAGSDVMLDRVIAVGGSQSAVNTGNGWLLRHSYFAAGGLKEDLTPIAKDTNDFAVSGWQNQGTDLVNIVVVNTHRNLIQHDIADYMDGSRTIDDLLIHHSDMSDPEKQPIALIPHQEGRGVGYGGSSSSGEMNILDSVVYAENSATNPEYGAPPPGCSLGGAYALQLENIIDSVISRSVFVANAAECEAYALRVGGASGVFSNTLITDNTFIAVGGIEGSEEYAAVFRFAQGAEIEISQNTAIASGLARIFHMDSSEIDGLTINATHIDLTQYGSSADNRLFVAQVWEEESGTPQPTDIYFTNSTFEDSSTENLIINNLGFWNAWNWQPLDMVKAHFED